MSSIPAPKTGDTIVVTEARRSALPSRHFEKPLVVMAVDHYRDENFTKIRLRKPDSDSMTSNVGFIYLTEGWRYDDYFQDQARKEKGLAPESKVGWKNGDQVIVRSVTELPSRKKPFTALNRPLFIVDHGTYYPRLSDHGPSKKTVRLGFTLDAYKDGPGYAGFVLEKEDDWYLFNPNQPFKEYAMPQAPTPTSTFARTIEGTVPQVLLKDEIIWQGAPLTVADLPADVNDDDEGLSPQLRLNNLAQKTADDYLASVVRGQFSGTLDTPGTPPSS